MVVVDVVGFVVAGVVGVDAVTGVVLGVVVVFFVVVIVVVAVVVVGVVVVVFDLNFDDFPPSAIRSYY